MTSLATLLILLSAALYFGYRWGVESERTEQALREDPFGITAEERW